MPSTPSQKTLCNDRPPRRWRGGALLAHYRQQHSNLTQQQLANRVGGSRSMIAQMETEKRQPSPHLLLAISVALQLSANEQAMLFVAFERVPPDPEHTLRAITAVILLDPALSAEHAQRLTDQVTAWYREALAEQGK